MRYPRVGRALLAAALMGGGCGLGSSDTLNHKSLDSQIGRQLKARYPVVHVTVSCPKGVKEKVGSMFSCSATLDGERVTLTGTVTSASGRYTIQPAQAIVVSSRTAATLQKQISSQLQESVAVECGPPAIRVVAVGDHFMCNAVLAGQAPRQVTVTVEDTSGRMAFSLATN